MVKHSGIKGVKAVLMITSVISIFLFFYFTPSTRIYSWFIPIIFLAFYYRPYRYRVFGIVRWMFIIAIWLAVMVGFNGPEKMNSHFESMRNNVTHVYHQTINQLKGEENNAEK